MSITQTAETIAAYDIKIAELSKAVNRARAESAMQGFALLWLTLLIGISGLMAILGLLAGILAPSYREESKTGWIMFGVFLPLGAVFFWRWKLRAITNAEAKSALRSAITEQAAMKARKDAIVTGVVAVTNREVEAVRQAANTVEAPVQASMGEKTCPMCAESVKAAAKKCKHCGHLFDS